jgi:hypothetical protein
LSTRALSRRKRRSARCRREAHPAIRPARSTTGSGCVFTRSCADALYVSSRGSGASRRATRPGLCGSPSWRAHFAATCPIDRPGLAGLRETGRGGWGIVGWPVWSDDLVPEARAVACAPVVGARPGRRRAKRADPSGFRGAGRSPVPATRNRVKLR